MKQSSKTSKKSRKGLIRKKRTRDSKEDQEFSREQLNREQVSPRLLKKVKQGTVETEGTVDDEQNKKKPVPQPQQAIVQSPVNSGPKQPTPAPFALDDDPYVNLADLQNAGGTPITPKELPTPNTADQPQSPDQKHYVPSSSNDSNPTPRSVTPTPMHNQPANGHLRKAKSVNRGEKIHSRVKLSKKY